MIAVVFTFVDFRATSKEGRNFPKNVRTLTETKEHKIRNNPGKGRTRLKQGDPDQTLIE